MSGCELAASPTTKANRKAGGATDTLPGPLGVVTVPDPVKVNVNAFLPVESPMCPDNAVRRTESLRGDPRVSVTHTFK